MAEQKISRQASNSSPAPVQQVSPQGFTFDYTQFSRFCGDAADHYEKCSPLVVTWLDQVLERIAQGTVTLREVSKVCYLYQESIWLDPHGAGNLAYKTMSDIHSLPSDVTLSF